MASNSTQERQEAFLNAVRKSQETVNHAINTWCETVTSMPPIPAELPPLMQLPPAFTPPDPQYVLTSACSFAEDLHASYRQFAGLPAAEEGAVAATPAREPARTPWPWVADEAPVYTMRDLNQRTAEVMREIEEHRKPAFITKHGRFVAMITPLEAGHVESRVLAEMARQINKGAGE